MKSVSIIVLFYNDEKFVERVMNNILNQTYKKIELITINDGSTDNTEKLILEYKERLINEGIDLKYYYQENKGPGGAMNLGIKYFTGEYLMWLDSDDFITNDSVEKKLEFLEKHKDYNLVRTSAIRLEEETLSFIANLGNDVNFGFNIFEGLIEEKVGCTPGRYMIRSSAFLEANPNREIYESKGGQNWQMLLPISYKGKCGYIDEILFKYVVRKASHSHRDEGVSLEVSLAKMSEHKKILIETLDRIEKVYGEVFDKERYLTLVKEKYCRREAILRKRYLGEGE